LFEKTGGRSWLLLMTDNVSAQHRQSSGVNHLVRLVREWLAQAENRGVTPELQPPHWGKAELGESSGE
jgi:hypothetical protein